MSEGRRMAPGLDHLWAAWRSAYLDAVVAGEQALGPDDVGRTLFERLLGTSATDGEAFIVHRGATCSVILNAYPYTSGHVLVLPNRGVADLTELTIEEQNELWSLVRDAVVALRGAYDCDGINVGMNLGRAAGAGVPDHLHVHVLPRWEGDTNFMTTVAETRVLPEALGASWQKLREAWPAGDASV